MSKPEPEPQGQGTPNGGEHCAPPGGPYNVCYRRPDGSCTSCNFEPEQQPRRIREGANWPEELARVEAHRTRERERADQLQVARDRMTAAYQATNKAYTAKAREHINERDRADRAREEADGWKRAYEGASQNVGQLEAENERLKTRLWSVEDGVIAAVNDEAEARAVSAAVSAETQIARVREYVEYCADRNAPLDYRRVLDLLATSEERE